MPSELLRVTAQGGAAIGSQVLIHDLWGDRDDMLALPVFDQVQRLKGQVRLRQDRRGGRNELRDSGFR